MYYCLAYMGSACTCLKGERVERQPRSEKRDEEQNKGPHAELVLAQRDEPTSAKGGSPFTSPGGPERSKESLTVQKQGAVQVEMAQQGSSAETPSTVVIVMGASVRGAYFSRAGSSRAGHHQGSFGVLASYMCCWLLLCVSAWVPCTGR